MVYTFCKVLLAYYPSKGFVRKAVLGGQGQGCQQRLLGSQLGAWWPDVSSAYRTIVTQG